MEVVMNKVTIKDIARMAGVSTATVSQVINSNGRISKATAAKVMKIIEEFNFHPNRAGRALVNRNTGNVGIFVSKDHFTIKEPFYDRIYIGAEVVAQESDYYLILNVVKNDHVVPRCLQEASIDGAILMGSVSRTIMDWIYQRNIPVVFVDYYPSDRPYMSVLINNEESAQTAVRHLIDLGYPTIGFIGSDYEHPSIAARYKGYTQALKKSGIRLDPRLVFQDKRSNNYQYGFDAGMEMIRSRRLPRAVFCANDMMALGLMRAMKLSRIAMPDTLALVGFDNIEAVSHVSPSLTTMHVFREEMGQIAMQNILRFLASKRTIYTTVQVNARLIVRESCGSPAKTEEENLYL